MYKFQQQVNGTLAMNSVEHEKCPDEISTLTMTDSLMWKFLTTGKIIYSVQVQKNSK